MPDSERGAGSWRHSRLFEDFVLSAMTVTQTPGVSVAVVQGGSIVYAAGLGIRGIDNPAPVTTQTPFLIGSATKPLTTLMTARLVDQGKLKWSTPIVELLKDFSFADPEAARQIQLRHAASNSTGMPHRNADFVFRHSGITAEARLAQLKNMLPTKAVGTAFQYSNFLFAAGGYAAARALAAQGPLEEAFEQALTELVFSPLKMNDSFLSPDLALEHEASCPHALNWEGGVSPIPLQLERACYHGMAPAGGVWSTAPDLARYLLLELGCGRVPDGRRVLSEDALLERRKKCIHVAGNLFYGLGLSVSEEPGLRLIYHNGNTFGFSAELGWLPEEDLGFVILTNLGMAVYLLEAIRHRLFELVLGTESKAEETLQAVQHKQAWTRKINSWVITDGAAMTWLDALLGTYRSQDLGAAQILKRDGGYWIRFEEWESALGAELHPDGSRVLYQTTPPWCCNRLLAAENGDLILEGRETQYVFQRQRA